MLVNPIFPTFVLVYPIISLSVAVHSVQVLFTVTLPTKAYIAYIYTLKNCVDYFHVYESARPEDNFRTQVFLALMVTKGQF